MSQSQDRRSCTAPNRPRIARIAVCARMATRCMSRCARPTAWRRLAITKKTSALGDMEIGANAAYVATDRNGTHAALGQLQRRGGQPRHRPEWRGDQESPEPNRNGPVRTCHPARCLQLVCLCAAHRPNAVSISFDAKTASLPGNDPFTAKLAEGLEPRHLAFHPKLPIVYRDTQRDSVTAYAFDRATGQLKALHTAVHVAGGI